MAVLEQLIHNGIVIPEPPEYHGLAIRVRGQAVRLSAKQEEMALAWARKKDTEYVRDPVFAANFLQDWSEVLGLKEPLRLDEVDLSPLYRLVDEERAAKDALTTEQRKALAAERRLQREAVKAQYGYAIVNGQRVELGTYMAEPSGIFMGRGQHPLRGRWKEGARQEDVTLNLSPDAPSVAGKWADRVWQPESMWVARWQDKLSGKLKYIWLSDTAPIKQQREADKFDKAEHLSQEIDRVRAEIRQGLEAEDPQKRTIATACYLIDTLCLRVGDEKDPDEADTVGATTLRLEHLTFGEDGVVEFRFLGKDSVEWHKKLEPPPVVLDNLRELVAKARRSSADESAVSRGMPQLFPDVTSRTVNAYLSGIVRGLTAKVFRTHHATVAVRQSLDEAGLKPSDPDYKKWEAASLANLQAAILCNHTRKDTGNWASARARYEDRRGKAHERIERYRQQVADVQARLEALRQEAKQKEAEAATPERARAVRERYAKRLAAARRLVAKTKERRQRAQQALGKINAQAAIAGKKRTWNLGTSLKSYIDPRVYHAWGKDVHYDVLERYYPTTLRRKFLWVRAADSDGDAGDEEITVRTCMASDLVAVASLLAAVKDEYPEFEAPRTPDELVDRYLPALDKPWCEAVIAIDAQKHLLAFAALGPEYDEDDRTAYVDVVAVTHPNYTSDALVRTLADALRLRLTRYAVHFPKKDYVLRPSDAEWMEYMPEIADALRLLDDGEEDEDDWDDAS